VGIVDFSQEARWLYMTDSVTDLLGYEPKDLRNRPSLELVHPDEASRVRQLHYDTIRQDKAACLVYLRMKHKDPYKGYILCGIVICHNVLVGSVSFASPGAKALHNASTAQEITVISPTPHNFEFRRWHDPSPMPMDPIPSALMPPSSPPSAHHPSPSSHSTSSTSPQTIRSRYNNGRGPPPNTPSTYDPLPSQSFRTCFILDRFSLKCPILYSSNSLLISDPQPTGRSFFDFVAKSDESIVREWISVVKGWGVNERGQPSDGGFGFGRFNLVVEGKSPDLSSSSSSVERDRDRDRDGVRERERERERYHAYDRHAHSSISGRYSSTTTTTTGETILVDAIFSAHSDGLMVILRRAM
ncbi:hypothetical protein K435DRAFT_663243, partial [Dendrothele bispora CBS 962.96]